MSNLRQTTLPFTRISGASSKRDVPTNLSHKTSTGSSLPKSSSSYSSHSDVANDEREHLRQLARETLATMQRGSYLTPLGNVVSIRDAIEKSRQGTLFYSPEAWDRWESTRPNRPTYVTQYRVLEIATMEVVRGLAEARLNQTDSREPITIGVLNFASATKPGGGFQNGAKAQEESITRVSSLYASLTTPTGLQFYKKNVREEQGPVYSHAMIYSPRVVVFNTDSRMHLEKPYEISVVTSPAVNAGLVRNQNCDENAEVEQAIARIMTERMGRILALFENRGDRWLVLGSYGTGVFRNSVETVAQIWKDLLLRDDSRFFGVFERVDFAIIGHDTFERFRTVFQPS